jgi:hypothetical protein
MPNFIRIQFYEWKDVTCLIFYLQSWHRRNNYEAERMDKSERNNRLL